MRRNFDNKIACLNHRLKKWSNKLKKPVFTFQTKDKCDESLEIMPVEKYFDYLLDIHVTHTDHGDVEKMIKVIKEEGVWMPYEAVYVFHKFCSKCSLMRKIAFRRYNARRKPNQTLSTATTHAKHLMRGFVEIIDMHSKPDGEYKYILHYRDISTHFSRLRPLKNPIASEVAEELFPIFMTNGAPAVLHAPVKRAFTAAIIKHLEPFMPDTKILVGNSKPSRKKEDKIPLLVNKWMENSKNNKWSIGIYYVECKMNNKAKNKLSAYEVMFQRTHGTGLFRRFSNTAARSIYKKIQYEEDLLLPSVEKYVLGAGEDINKTVKVLSEDKQMGNDWCAVCGFDVADSMCQVCGVAMHKRCNGDEQQLCDCCRTFSGNHDHLQHQDYVKTKSFLLLQSDNATVTNAQSGNVTKIIKKLVKIGKTDAQVSKTAVLVKPSGPVEVPKTDGRIEDVATTSAEPSHVVDLTDDRTAFKVGRIIAQYGKRKKPIASTDAKQPGAVVDAVGDKRQKTIDPKDDDAVDIKNVTLIVQANTGDVRDGAVDVNDGPVKIKVEADANVKQDAVNVKQDTVDVNNFEKIKQEVEMEVVNVFDEVFEIEKKDPF